MFHIMSVDDIKKNICKKNKKQKTLKNTFFLLYLEQPGGGERVDFMFIVVFLMLNQC